MKLKPQQETKTIIQRERKSYAVIFDPLGILRPDP